MPFYLELSEMPARNAEAIWEVQVMFWRLPEILGGGRAARGKGPGWDLLWHCWWWLWAGDTATFPWGSCAGEKIRSSYTKCRICSCEGWQKFQIKNPGELTKLMEQQCLCWVPACTSEPEGSPSWAWTFAHLWNGLDCSHEVAWIQPEFIILCSKLKLISKESFCTKFCLTKLKNT